MPAACPVCGSLTCAPAPVLDHLASYPFLPGGRDPMANVRTVPAPERVFDGDGVLKYGTGSPVPWDEAVTLGFVAADAPAEAAAKPAPKGRRARKGPAEDRAHKPAEDR